MRLQAQRSSVRLAREFVATTLLDLHLDDRVDDARLVTSELVSNAVLHGRREHENRDLLVRVSTSDDTVRIEVRDDSSARPLVGEPTLRDPSGRGMYIVARLASDWGIRSDRVGKWVWAELGGPTTGHACQDDSSGPSPT